MKQGVKKKFSISEITPVQFSFLYPGLGCQQVLLDWKWFCHNLKCSKRGNKGNGHEYIWIWGKLKKNLFYAE